MTPTKFQQAQEYSKKKFPELLLTIEKEPWPKTREILAKAYSDGYTASEQSMWRSVEEELPEEGQAIIIRVVHKEVKSGKIFESYFNTFYFEQYGFEIEERPQRGKISKITHWKPKPNLPIPSLPETNTEKK